MLAKTTRAGTGTPGGVPRGRHGWQRRIEELDPVRDHEEIHRITDTALLMAELVEHGYDSERGIESLRFRFYRQVGVRMGITPTTTIGSAPTR